MDSFLEDSCLKSETRTNHKISLNYIESLFRTSCYHVIEIRCQTLCCLAFAAFASAAALPITWIETVMIMQMIESGYSNPNEGSKRHLVPISSSLSQNLSLHTWGIIQSLLFTNCIESPPHSTISFAFRSTSTGMISMPFSSASFAQ